MFRWLLFVCLLGIATPGYALYEGQRRNMEAFASLAQFQSGASAPYIELYYELNPATLFYRKDSLGRLSARIHTQIRVSTDTGVFFRNDFYLQTKPFTAGAEEAPRILEQERIPLADGFFKVELFLSDDEHPASRFYFKDTLSITSVMPKYSSIKLLDTFFSSTVSSPFLKNKMQLLPHPLNFYDEGKNLVHLYFELYDNSAHDSTDFPLEQIVFISKDKNIRQYPALEIRDTITGPANIAWFQRTVNTATLPSGNYWVNVLLKNKAGRDIASNSVYIQTLNKNPVKQTVANASTDSNATNAQPSAQLLDLGVTFIAKYDMAQLRAILKMIRPRANGAEEAAIHGFLQRPEELYMRYFIYNYFAGINKDDPAKAWKEYSDQVREVNRRFGSGGIPGYETERGIIYLRYGKPDEEVRAPNEAGALPYEIWRYNPNQRMMGPGLFLFYSPGSMSSDYRLLHSTVRGETQNPYWRNTLYVTGRSSGNTNARAEEYFGKQ